jgi:hypothetical protein
VRREDVVVGTVLKYKSPHTRGMLRIVKVTRSMVHLQNEGRAPAKKHEGTLFLNIEQVLRRGVLLRTARVGRSR